LRPGRHVDGFDDATQLDDQRLVLTAENQYQALQRHGLQHINHRTLQFAVLIDVQQLPSG
jgi:hypothetical protein